MSADRFTGAGEAAVVTAAAMAGRWQMRWWSGTVAALHGIDPSKLPSEETARPAVWVCQPTRPAVVLGSTQPRAVVDTDAAARWGLDIVVRRSGGGAVLVTPDDVVWVDLWVPRGDVEWDDDVGRAAHWVGEVWADVASRLGVEARAHTGAMHVDALGRLVCFVGVGPGELLVGDAKLVGVSQRRVRAGARFQCQWIRRWAPEALVETLDIADTDERRRISGAGVGVDVPAEIVIAALVEVLTRR